MFVSALTYGGAGSELWYRSPTELSWGMEGSGRL